MERNITKLGGETDEEVGWVLSSFESWLLRPLNRIDDKAVVVFDEEDVDEIGDDEDEEVEDGLITRLGLPSRWCERLTLAWYKSSRRSLSSVMSKFDDDESSDAKLGGRLGFADRLTSLCIASI